LKLLAELDSPTISVFDLIEYQEEIVEKNDDDVIDGRDKSLNMKNINSVLVYVVRFDPPIRWPLIIRLCVVEQ
jgi:hypothetical protein